MVVQNRLEEMECWESLDCTSRPDRQLWLSKSSLLRLSHDELLTLKGDNTYDEIDLVSECSTPCSYSPGRFLQLVDYCDEDDETDLKDDVTIWPVSLGPSFGDNGTTKLLTGHCKLSMPDTFLHTDTMSFNRRFPPYLSSTRFVLPLLLCLFLAISMLGFLMTFV